MSEYRKSLKVEEREAGFEEVREKITSSEPLPDIIQSSSDIKLSDLKQKRDSARAAIKKSRGNIQLRQEWLFYEALYRDAMYASRGRGWMRQLGWDGLLDEVYGGCRAAIDAGLEA